MEIQLAFKKKPPRYAILILHLMHGVVVMMVMLLMMAAFRKCRGRQQANMIPANTNARVFFFISSPSS
jgi:hypothetical protein